VPVNLRVNQARGPTRLALESRVRNTITTTTVDRGTNRTGPTETTASARELVTLSNAASDGTWRSARSELVQFDGVLPGTILEFERGADRWTARFARGGFASGNMTAEYFYPSYAGLALSPETVADVRATVGAEWSVPLSAVRQIVMGSYFVAPEGTIRGRVKAVDPAAQPAWVDLEYTFDVRGAVRLPGLSSTPNMRTEVSGRDTGTLSLRLLVREAYVSESRFERRSVIEGKTTPVGSSLSVAGSSFTNEVTSVIETRATPAAGEGASVLFTQPGEAAGTRRADATIYELNQVDRAPRPVTRTPPSYPASLQRAGISGTVMVEFVVDARGAVQHARALSTSHRLFEAPALAAVRTWSYQPAQKGGQPVAVRLELPIEFKLEE
jgi:TonB family protein